jgi:glycosyltransferase involved in cell wall biosynthesis
MRVLYLYVPTYLNPPWSVCREIISRLPTDRVTPLVVADVGAGNPGVPPSVPVHRFELGGALSALRRRPRAALSLAGSIASVVRLVLQEKVDIVHVNDDAPSMMLGAAIAKFTGRKLLLHFHSRIDREDGERLVGPRIALFRAPVMLADLCVGCSHYEAKEVGRVLGGRRLAAVLNGIDVERFHPGLDREVLRKEYGYTSSDVVVLQLARIQKAKRQEDLIRAMALAQKRAPNLRALIVGWTDPRYSGEFQDYEHELRHLIELNGLQKIVKIAPARPEAHLLHAASDIGILPSSREPFGLVLPEAMAVGRPVIGADSGGIPEIIEDGRSGFLAPLGSAEKIADALVELATKPELRQKMGEAARKRAVDVLSMTRLAEQFATLYEAIHRGASIPEELVVRP